MQVCIVHCLQPSFPKSWFLARKELVHQHRRACHVAEPLLQRLPLADRHRGILDFLSAWSSPPLPMSLAVLAWGACEPHDASRQLRHVIVPNWGLSELTGFDGELRSFGTSEPPFGSVCRQSGGPRSTRQPGKSTGDRCPLRRARAVRLRRPRAGLLQRRAPPAPPRLRPCAAPVESRLTSSLPAEHCRRQLRQRQRCRPAWSPCRIRTQRLRTMHLRRRRACPRPRP